MKLTKFIVPFIFVIFSQKSLAASRYYDCLDDDSFPASVRVFNDGGSWILELNGMTYWPNQVSLYTGLFDYNLTFYIPSKGKTYACTELIFD